MALTPRLEASDAVTTEASIEPPGADAACASASDPSRITVIVGTTDVTIGVSTVTDEPMAASSEVVSASVSCATAVAFALKLSFTPAGVSTTNVTCADCSARR